MILYTKCRTLVWYCLEKEGHKSMNIFIHIFDNERYMQFTTQKWYYFERESGTQKRKYCCSFFSNDGRLQFTKLNWHCFQGEGHIHKSRWTSPRLHRPVLLWVCLPLWATSCGIVYRRQGKSVSSQHEAMQQQQQQHIIKSTAFSTHTTQLNTTHLHNIWQYKTSQHNTTQNIATQHMYTTTQRMFTVQFTTQHNICI